jgi:hypothetical protein
MSLERFLTRQNIERYRRLLDIVSEATQRRQIINLLEEEEDKERDWRESSRHLDLSEAA